MTPERLALRLRALRALDILDTAPEPEWDGLTELAVQLTGMPIALIAFEDLGRQWFKSRVGLEISELRSEDSYCDCVIREDAPLMVEDARLDPRFAGSSMVMSGMVAYVGFPIHGPDGLAVGSLAVVARTPTVLSPQQTSGLRLLAKQAEALLALRRANVVLDAQLERAATFEAFFDQSVELHATIGPDLRFVSLNPAWEVVLGWTRDELRSVTLPSLIHPDDLDGTVAEAARLLSSAAYTTVGFQNRYRHADGSWVPLSWVAVARNGVFVCSVRDMRSAIAHQQALERSAAEASEAAARLAAVLDAADYAIVETDGDGVIQRFNAAAERLLGYRADEVIGERTPDVFHDPAELAAVALARGRPLVDGGCGFLSLAADGRQMPSEWTWRRKDGAALPVELSIAVRRDPQGAILGGLGIATDIRRRRSAEARLRESEARLSAVFQGMAEGVVIQDAAGAIVEANEAAERILGLTRDQLMGRTSIDPRWNSTHPDGTPYPGSEHPAMVTLRTGQPCHDVPMAVHPVDGARRLLSVSSRPLEVRGDGAAAAVVATFRDITRQAEVETRLRSIIETAVDPLVTVRADGSIDLVNPSLERAFGYEASELLGMPIASLLPPELGGLRLDASSPVGVPREAVARKRDGTQFPVELTISGFRVHQERYFTVVVRDISERKQVERLQSEFVSTVSHELRTPLTSIRGALGLVASERFGALPGDARKFVTIALSNCERLVRLVNDILDFEKISSGRVAFRYARTGLEEVLGAAIVANEGFAQTFQVTLRRTGPPATGYVLVDPDRMIQALTNLLSNAAKFSPPNELVELSTHPVGDDGVRIEIRDRGPGIPPEFASRMFERFSQADASTTREKGGTGLGLSITKAIVEKMGGRVGFRGAEGVGSVFFVELPLMRLADPALEPAPPPPELG